MMKNLLAVTLIFTSNFLFSQDYTKKIAKVTCECFTKAKAENPNSKNLEAQLGLCMIKAAEPYSKDLKKDYNIDILNDESSETGKLMGTWLLKECPDIFMEFVNMEEDKKTDESKPELLINGTITKIEKENFVIFHMIGDNKNLTKFYWVSNIVSNLDLPKEYNSLINKKVSISYYTTEIFDSKINDYRNLNIISSLKTD
ncbi:hypothetical protein SAMN05421664_3135 [Chryseobacterium soldanellicola]|uniref:Uncharacterized protein n=1 Tax=Chryseobacterium soldanellicola TaxID=311333 RepID=A0A1H1FMC9_9FLAO|nr:hypothetical protein [Chryseobacterium soldanellicola]SDR01879.1 hypothetical protein SAMN05421664_3135 [Chryseobacterium soldanellicola]